MTADSLRDRVDDAAADPPTARADSHHDRRPLACPDDDVLRALAQGARLTSGVSLPDGMAHFSTSPTRFSHGLTTSSPKLVGSTTGRRTRLVDNQEVDEGLRGLFRHPTPARDSRSRQLEDVAGAAYTARHRDQVWVLGEDDHLPILGRLTHQLESQPQTVRVVVGEGVVQKKRCLSLGGREKARYLKSLHEEDLILGCPAEEVDTLQADAGNNNVHSEIVVDLRFPVPPTRDAREISDECIAEMRLELHGEAPRRTP